MAARSALTSATSFPRVISVATISSSSSESTCMPLCLPPSPGAAGSSTALGSGKGRASLMPIS
eukprot:15482086-Alexandrium_andersonii.AAC.1